MDYIRSVIPGSNGGDYRVNLRMLRVGPIALMGFSGELFTQLGLDIKKASPLPDTLVVNHVWGEAGEQTGYHADDAAKALGGFGTDGRYQPSPGGVRPRRRPPPRSGHGVERGGAVPLFRPESYRHAEGIGP
ncbi:hypothetical protein FHW96_004465 [Novosphingobium sp. SG751A]|uniref:hypothetical protein n=1 Tax=Novosphingobium sp. SG751A TaxID=2587000 RepID=UPI0015568D31|nr:hypothetical protein [Novosphingobium sp. SG751A]NOW48277.1 hypothetical protein [Novosphingobium sp. SG751A]